MSDTLVTEHYKLNDAIREMYDNTCIADPGELADMLIAKIPAKHRQEVLRVTLREFVRVWFSRQRMERRYDDLVVKFGDSPSDPKPITVSRPSGKPNQKYAGLVDALLRERLNVGEKQWKMFGECTAGDLEFLVQERRTFAAKSAAKAEFYARVQDALKKHDCKVVGRLPREVLQEFSE